MQIQGNFNYNNFIVKWENILKTLRQNKCSEDWSDYIYYQTERECELSYIFECDKCPILKACNVDMNLLSRILYIFTDGQKSLKPSIQKKCIKITQNILQDILNIENKVIEC